MIHKQTSNPNDEESKQPDWVAKMPMCGRGMKAADTLSLDSGEVDCKPCLHQLKRAVEAPAE